MGFFDVNKYSKTVDEKKAVFHPILKNSPTLDLKYSYIGTMIFASLVADTWSTDEAKHIIRMTVSSLGLTENDFSDISDTVLHLKDDKEKQLFLADSFHLISSRDAAMFFYAEIIRVMECSGTLSEDSVTFLDSIAKMLPFKKEDIVFFEKLREVFFPAKKDALSAFIFSNGQNSCKLPQDYFQYLAPDILKQSQNIEKQYDVLNSLIRNLVEEFCCLLWTLSSDDLEKRTIEDNQNIQKLHAAFPEIKKNSLMLQDFYTDPALCHKFAVWLIQQMTVRFSEINIQFIAELLCRKEWEATANSEPNKYTFPLSQYDYDDDISEKMFYIDRSSSAESNAARKFARLFQKEKTEQFFFSNCAEKYQGILGQTSDLTHCDSWWGHCIFISILALALAAEKRNIPIAFNKSFFAGLKDLTLVQKTNSELREILWKWVDPPEEYDYKITYDDISELVDLNYAYQEMESDYNRAFEEVVNDYFDIADENLKHIKKTCSKFTDHVLKTIHQ